MKFIAERTISEKYNNGLEVQDGIRFFKRTVRYKATL